MLLEGLRQELCKGRELSGRQGGMGVGRAGAKDA